MKLVELCLLDEVHSVLNGVKSYALLDFGQMNELYHNALISTAKLHESIMNGLPLNEITSALKNKTKCCTAFTVATGLKWPL